MAYTGQTIKTMVIIGENPEDCWQWIGSKNAKTGYGKKTVGGKSVLAHRWVYESFIGPIPEGLVINHKCGNPGCVNPHHLEVTDQAGNCRHGKGCKLTAGQVAEIKEAKTRKKWGLGSQLARHYGVSPALIHDIWNGRAWKDAA